MFDWFRNAPQTRQIQVIAAAAGILTVLLGLMWFLFIRTTYLPLFSDLRAGDAATIVSVLDRKKIPYRLADGGATILVPEDLVDSTRLSVMSEDVPLKGTVGFELFNKSDMGLTDFAQKINYQRALQGELERTIMTLDGIDTARVHISLGEDRLFREDRVPPKASVTIRMAKGAALSEESAQGIKRLVAAAVANLDIANVVILDEEGDVVGSAPSEPADTAISPQAEEQRAIEQYYEARIRDVLAGVRLAAPIGVGVQAELPAADGSQSLTGWTPGQRSFPLQVTLSPETSLDPATQDAVRVAALNAIASGTAQSDVVTFGVPQARPEQSLPVAPASRTQREAVASTPAEAGAPDDGYAFVLALAAALLVAAAVVAGLVFALRRSRSSDRLSDRRRAAFAGKLRAVLDEGSGHATSET